MTICGPFHGTLQTGITQIILLLILHVCLCKKHFWLTLNKLQLFSVEYQLKSKRKTNSSWKTFQHRLVTIYALNRRSLLRGSDRHFRTQTHHHTAAHWPLPPAALVLTFYEHRNRTVCRLFCTPPPTCLTSASSWLNVSDKQRHLEREKQERERERATCKI